MKRIVLAGLLLALPSFAQKLIPVDEAAYVSLIKSKPGSVLVVDFWATWCAPCRKEMPFLAGLDQKLRSKGMILITVSADEPEQENDAVQFLKRSKITFPAYVKRPKDDDRFIRAVDPKWSGALPTLIIYDRQGRKTATFEGETQPTVIEKAIAKALEAR